MVERTIDFPDEVYKELKKRSNKTGQSIAGQIKRAVADEVGVTDHEI